MFTRINYENSPGYSWRNMTSPLEKVTSRDFQIEVVYYRTEEYVRESIGFLRDFYEQPVQENFLLNL
jgi:hypothetical protein